MANDIQKFFGGHQVVDRQKSRESLQNFSAAKNSLSGKALLRLTKTGVWVFGQDSEVLELGTKLIVNDQSLSSGYVAWYLGKPEGEIMQPLHQGPVDPQRLTPVNSGTVPPGKTQPSGKGWEPQTSVDLITQHDTPLQLTFKTSSRGGMKCLMTLAGEIAYGQSEDERRAYPVVSLQRSSYPHSEFGLVWEPILLIESWLGEDGKPVVERKKLV